MLSHEKEARNEYEDSDNDNSDVQLLKRRGSIGNSYGEGSGWRLEKRMRVNYDSNMEQYRSPPC